MSYLPPFNHTPATGYSTTDYLTQAGASELAQTIEQVWHRAGHRNVRASIEHDALRKIWPVRTNLIRGMPPAESVEPSQRAA